MHDFSNKKNEKKMIKFIKKILPFHHKLYIFISRLELQLTTCYQILEFLVGYREQEQRKWEK